MPKILFLSAEDFKEKSIQVIRKTPEAYVKAGWDVNYIVIRDNSNKGNYFYEKEIFLEGVKIQRVNQRLTSLLNKVSSPTLVGILFRIRRYVSILQLMYLGYKFLKREKVDVVYGYEQVGFISTRLLKLLGLTGNAKIIARFQGVLYVKEWLRQKRKLRRVSNFDTFFALSTSSDLCIMTNDGSQGDWVLGELRSRHNNVEFLVNGVDDHELSIERLAMLREELTAAIQGRVIFISVSRLDDHKRIDRCIRVIDKLVNQLGMREACYLIVGEGVLRRRFENLVAELKLTENVSFVGGVNQCDVPYYLSLADVFLSMYESSNVGNPLLEAIRARKIIVTLANGDTGSWINHQVSGLIYDVDDVADLKDEQYTLIATDILVLLRNRDRSEKMIENLKVLTEDKIWSWEQRFDREINAVERLFTS